MGHGADNGDSILEVLGELWCQEPTIVGHGLMAAADAREVLQTEIYGHYFQI
jgi:hypothetical protein